MQSARKLFSRFGFAQVAGMLAFLPISLLLLPYITEESIQGLVAAVGPSLSLLMTYIPNFVFLLVFWLIIRKVPKTSWQTRRMSFGAAVKIFVMMYAAASVMNLLGLSVSETAPAGGVEQLDLIESFVSTRLLVGFMVPAVLGPIVEELIFRKLMIDRLHQYGEAAVIVFTSLCFGLFHGNLAQFLYAGCVGLFLGYVYCKTGKVLHTIIMHILLNTISSSIILLLPLVQESTEDKAVLSFLVIVGLVLLIGVMFISGVVQIIRHLKRKDIVLDASAPEAIPKNEVLKTVYLNPGVMLLFVISIAGIVMDLFKIELPF